MDAYYHGDNSLSSGAYPDTAVRTTANASSNPYAIIPPIGRLLDRLCAELSVGGCIRPGNRTIADWLDLASAGSIPGLIAQLVSDGWIAYNRETSMITLLRSMHAPKQPKRLNRPRLSSTEYQAQYRARNRTRILEQSRAYAAGHRAERAASYHATLAKRRGDNGRWTAEEWRAMCAWFGDICLCCGAPGVTIDHVIPKGRRHGGENVIANLQPLCKACNLRKHNAVIDYRDQDRLAAFLESISTPITAHADERPIDRNDRDLAHQDAADLSNRSPKPAESACMVLATASTNTLNKKVAVGYGGMQGGDQRADHPPPAAQVMAELGANPRIIRDAYQSRPDWTAEQVRGRWEYDQRRIAASDGRLNEGIFFTALRNGELAPARPDPAAPLDPLRYADDPAFRLGSTAVPDAAAERNARYRDAHWKAVDLLGPGAALDDMRVVVEALVDGATDAQALEALRSGVER